MATILTPDRGWAWAVMAGCFVNTLVAFLFVRSLPIFYLAFLARFGKSATLTSLTFTLSTVFLSLGALLVPALLLPRFSVRAVTLAGAVVASISTVAMAFFSTTLTHIQVGFSVLGLTNAMVLISQVTLLGVYFKKKFSFASAFANLGISIGTMVGPAFTQMLEDRYGLHGALLIHGGLGMHSLAACLLFRPPPPPPPPPAAHTSAASEKEEHESGQKQSGVELDSLMPGGDQQGNARKGSEAKDGIDAKNINGSYSQLPCETGKESRENGVEPATGQWPSDQCDSALRKDYWEGKDGAGIDTEDINDSSSLLSSANGMEWNKPPKETRRKDYGIDMANGGTDTTNGPSPLSNKSLSKPSISSRSSANKLDELDDKERFLGHESKSGSNHDDDNEEHDENKDETPKERSTCFSSRLLRHIRNSHLANPVALLLILASGVGINTHVGTLYLPSLGAELGVERSALPYLVTAVGASDLAKLLIGYAADKEVLSRLHITCLTQLAAGVALNLAGACRGLPPLLVVAVIFGATSGTFHALVPGITVDLLGGAYIGHVMSGYLLVNGAIMSTLHLAVGSLKDETGSYVGAYHLMGCLVLLSIAMLLAETRVKRWWNRRRQSAAASGR